MQPTNQTEVSFFAPVFFPLPYMTPRRLTLVLPSNGLHWLHKDKAVIFFGLAVLALLSTSGVPYPTVNEPWFSSLASFHPV